MGTRRQGTLAGGMWPVLHSQSAYTRLTTATAAGGPVEEGAGTGTLSFLLRTFLVAPAPPAGSSRPDRQAATSLSVGSAMRSR